MPEVPESTETVEQEVTEPEQTQEVTPEEHALIIKMREMHPDVTDHNALLDKAHEHMTGLEDYVERDKVKNSRILQLAKQNPALVKIIQMLDEGFDMEEAVARNIDLSAFPRPGDENYDEWLANPDYSKVAEQAKTRENEYNQGVEFENTLAQNKIKSQQNLKDFADENGLSEDQAMEFISSVVSPLLDKIATLDFDKDFLAMLYKGVNHEQDVASAKEEGVIAGKNANIEEIMQPAPSGDGLPKASSASAEANPKPTKKEDYIDYLKKS